jgi:hypothetical protein
MAGDHRSVEQHGGAKGRRRWQSGGRGMIVDGRVGAEVRCRESRQDRRPGEYVSRGHGRAS